MDDRTKSKQMSVLGKSTGKIMYIFKDRMKTRTKGKTIASFIESQYVNVELAIETINPSKINPKK